MGDKKTSALLCGLFVKNLYRATGLSKIRELFWCTSLTIKPAARSLAMCELFFVWNNWNSWDKHTSVLEKLWDSQCTGTGRAANSWDFVCLKESLSWSCFSHEYHDVGYFVIHYTFLSAWDWFSKCGIKRAQRQPSNPYWSWKYFLCYYTIFGEWMQRIAAELL